MSAPASDQLFATVDATWAPAQSIRVGPWRLREGLGGGQRVSAATAEEPVNENDIALAEHGMRELGQPPIFMIRPSDVGLDAMLGTRGYRVVDPVVLRLSEVGKLAASPGPAAIFPAWPPMAIMRDLWEKAGIGPARIDVMARVTVPKVALLGRLNDRPAGVGFLAVNGDVAMLHALEVMPFARRKGLGARMMRAAAEWASVAGARWLAVLVVAANEPGNALYQALGMDEVTRYHYRRLPEVDR